MKKLIKPITILSLAAALFLFPVNSQTPQRTAVAQEKPAAAPPASPQPTGQILKKLDETSVAVDAYKKATDDRIAAAEAQIAELKATVADLKGEVAALKTPPPVTPTPVVVEETQPQPTYVVPTYTQPYYYYQPCVSQPACQPVRRGLIFRR